MPPDRLNVRPNLIIPGVQKGATTTLFEAFGHHPRCLTSHWKEPDVFAYAPKLDQEEPYGEYFRPEDDRTLDSYDYIVESSTSYFFVEESPRRLAQHLPESTKFIVLLKDPVARAVSAYWHLVKRREESRPLEEVFADPGTSPEEIRRTEYESIEQARRDDRIDPENFRKRYDDPLFPYRYVYNSCYSVHLDRFLDRIDRSRVLFLLTERMREQPETVVRRIDDFLELERPLRMEDLRSEHNRTVVPRSSTLTGKLKGLARTLLPDALRSSSATRSLYKSLFYRAKPEPEPRLVERLRQSLEEQYRTLGRRLDLPVRTFWEHA